MKVMVLLSGGIDSSTVLAMMRGKEKVAAVGFDYGQAHRIELERAAAIAFSEAVPFEVVKVPFIGKVDDVVFAGRNAVLISVAASAAVSKGYNCVAIGSTFTDWERFPDCRPVFVKAMGEAVREGYGVHLLAPLLRMSKSQVVELAKSLNVPLELTWSCYAPRNGQPCHECLACDVRRKAGA